MRKLITAAACSAIALSLLSGCSSQDYDRGVKLFEKGEYDESAEIFSDLGDYEDSEEMLAKCEREIMLRDYAEVIELLDGTWYANGGTEAAMYCYDFDGASVAVRRIDNDVKDAESSLLSLPTVSDKKIRQLRIDDSKISFYDGGDEVESHPYAIEDGKLVLDEGMTLSEADVIEGLTGTWTGCAWNSVLGETVKVQHSYEVAPDHITYENANAGSPLAGLEEGEYFYYGPVTHSYDLSDGIIDFQYGKTSYSSTEINMSGIRFNIIDGQPTLFHKTTKLERIEKLPGQDGYSF